VLVVAVLLPIVTAVMEQVRGPRGVSWRQGTYRNRNVIPMPPGFLEKKHRRDEQSDVDEEEDNEGDRDVKYRKKSFINEHFSLPIGAQIPLGYNNRVPKKGKAKKSEISGIPLSARLGASSKTVFEKALESEQDKVEARSDVPTTWGLTWKDPHPNPELNKDTSGYGRSNLGGREEGLTKTGKISVQEFDSGLMGRGLGGMTERAQNENLMEQKFAEQMDDEEDVEHENEARSRS